VRKILLALGFVACVGVPPTFAQTTQTFLLVPGIQGSSVDEHHKNWIDVLSLTQTLDGGGKRPQCSLEVVKALDVAGPLLWGAAVTAQSFDEIQIRRPAGRRRSRGLLPDQAAERPRHRVMPAPLYESPQHLDDRKRRIRRTRHTGCRIGHAAVPAAKTGRLIRRQRGVDVLLLTARTRIRDRAASTQLLVGVDAVGRRSVVGEGFKSSLSVFSRTAGECVPAGGVDRLLGGTRPSLIAFPSGCRAKWRSRTASARSRRTCNTP
jgi:hypothetical protein